MEVKMEPTLLCSAQNTLGESLDLFEALDGYYIIRAKYTNGITDHMSSYDRNSLSSKFDQFAHEGKTLTELFPEE